MLQLPLLFPRVFRWKRGLYCWSSAPESLTWQQSDRLQMGLSWQRRANASETKGSPYCHMEQTNGLSRLAVCLWQWPGGGRVQHRVTNASEGNNLFGKVFRSKLCMHLLHCQTRTCFACTAQHAHASVGRAVVPGWTDPCLALCIAIPNVCAHLR